jgi:ankyrin repeat protein
MAQEGGELLAAVNEGDYDRVVQLIDKGASFDVTDEDGETLLHIAAERGHDRIAALLVEKGLDVNARNNDGGTPLHKAAGMGDFETTSMLVEHGADVRAVSEYKDTPLHRAAEMRNLEMARINRAMGIKSTYNWKEDNLKVAELLIENGADLNAQDKFGRTPLQRTTPWNNLPVASLLVESGADVNLKDEDGMTPFQHAKAKGARDVAKMLKKLQKKR